MGESIGHLTLLSLFVEGVLSFFSPCVLPLVPLYISYLSADARAMDAAGNTHYVQRKVFLKTCFFVLGIATTFFLFGVLFSCLRSYIERYQETIAIVGGCIVIVFAFVQADILRWQNFLYKEFRLPFSIQQSMGYLKALLFGFIFSFAWTPCVGPLLSSVLLLAASDTVKANLYLLFYMLGFALPFLALGVSTNKVLFFLEKKKRILQYTMKIAAVVLFFFGAKMIYDGSQKIELLKKREAVTKENHAAKEFMQMTFTDQNGNSHILAEQKEEVIYLNFIATWCSYCKQEIPYYQKFLAENKIKGYYVMSPTMNQSNGGGSKNITEFAQEKGINIPILMDENDVLFSQFGIRGVPTLFALDPNGEIIGYVSGMMQDEQFAFTHKIVLEKIAAQKK